MLVLLAATLCTAAPVEQCTCTPVPEPRSAMEMRSIVVTTGAVLEGEVLHVKDRVDEVGVDRPMRFRTREVALRVQRRWAGPDADTVVVRTAAPDTRCAVAFAPGDRWLVFAQSTDGGELWATSCGLTRRVAQAGHELALLAELSAAR